VSKEDRRWGGLRGKKNMGRGGAPAGSRANGVLERESRRPFLSKEGEKKVGSDRKRRGGGTAETG